MNLQVLSDYLQSKSFAPTLILACLLLLAAWVLLRAQRRPDFDLADMLRDDAGKLSSTRIFAFISLAITSWILAYLTVTEKLNENYYLYYLVTWSGATVLMKFIDRWGGVVTVQQAPPPPPPGPAGDVNVGVNVGQ